MRCLDDDHSNCEVMCWLTARSDLESTDFYIIDLCLDPSARDGHGQLRSMYCCHFSYAEFAWRAPSYAATPCSLTTDECLELSNALTPDIIANQRSKVRGR
jgi:hypothetical protein